MDVRDFIDMTLKEIVAGITKAQASEGGEAINAEMGDVSVSGNLISTKGAGLFTRVDFDVAVSAEGTGRAGGSLTVFGVGVKAGGESKSGYANRILFSVPVLSQNSHWEGGLAASVAAGRRPHRGEV
jgi:hypothetical protein